MIICTSRIREWKLQIWNWSTSVQHEIAQHFTISFQCFKKKKKIFKNWQVYDWRTKWLIMSGYMDLRRPRVYRRSNVGLVLSVDSKTRWQTSHSSVTWAKPGDKIATVPWPDPDVFAFPWHWNFAGRWNSPPMKTRISTLCKSVSWLLITRERRS